MEKIDKIDKQNIDNEDNVIIGYKAWKGLYKSDIKNCVFKLKIKI